MLSTKNNKALIIKQSWLAKALTSRIWILNAVKTSSCHLTTSASPILDKIPHVPTPSRLILCRVQMEAASPTFPLDAVVLLAVLMRQGVRARLRQHVLRGARDPVLTLGVLGAQGARGGHALDLPTERTLAGAHPLAHCTARHDWILLGTVCRHTHKNTQQLLVIICSWPTKIFWFTPLWRVYSDKQ